MFKWSIWNCWQDENFNVDKSSGSNYSWTTEWTGDIGFNNAGDIKNSNWGFLTAQENENWNGRHTGPIVASDYLNSGGDGGKFLIYKSNGLNKPEAEIVSPAIDLSPLMEMENCRFLSINMEDKVIYKPQVLVN